ncbi:hypothetical protein E6W39_30460 [Kitasatospora acidiphila]|uniref:Peptidase MA-like domain-containing protein n=1 Tax=Kitasatospora acidiphila TaxID=2567942 RepID=A0A540W9U2_9ACTN|nr:hypothetical protein [Kitasatospora acidiphila]TQF05768.1 hypothetical protein E6W39_30460 [Kitasatospora acidiphila]
MESAAHAGAASRAGVSRRTALLLVAGALTQLSLPPAAAPSADRRPADGRLAADRLTALLARRADRLRTGELAALPLAELDYRPVGWDAGTVTAELRYRLLGYDDYPAVLQRRLTLAGAAVTGEGAAPDAAAAPWDLGTPDPVRGARCLVLGPAGSAELAALAAIGDRAVPAVSAVWGTGWAQRLVLQLPGSEPQFAQLLGVDPGSYQDIAAVTSAAAGAPLHTPADRVMVNPDAFRQLSEVGKQVVITHETTHVATRGDTHPWTPLWLSEGVADWTAYLTTGRTARQIAPELTQDVAAGKLPTALPADSDFAAGAQGIAQAYELAWLACDLIARRHGRPVLVGLYRAVGAAGPGAVRDQRLDQVFQRQLGYGLAQFTRDWIGEVERQLSPQA